MKNYLPLLILCASLPVLAQTQQLRKNGLVFSGFEKYGYTLYITVKDDNYTESALKGICDITNNTDTIISGYIKSNDHMEFYFKDEGDSLLSGDTRRLGYTIQYPLERTKPEKMMSESTSTQTYSEWNKNLLFDYIKKSDNFYQVYLVFGSAPWYMSNHHFFVFFKMPVNSIKEIIWIDKRKNHTSL